MVTLLAAWWQGMEAAVGLIGAGLVVLCVLSISLFALAIVWSLLLDARDLWRRRRRHRARVIAIDAGNRDRYMDRLGRAMHGRGGPKNVA